MEKKDVKPFIDNDLREIIYKINFITGYSVNNICEDLCNKAFEGDLGKELSPYFRRSLNIGGVMYQGNENPKRFERKKGKIERISMKIDPQMYEYAYSLAYAIGCSVAKVIAYCVEKSMHDKAFMDRYVKRYLNEKIDESRKELLQNIIEDINDDLKEEHTVTALLFGIVDNIKQPEQSVPEAVGSFAAKW